MRSFADELAGARWFAACGEALTAAERADAARYLEGLRLPAMPVEGVSTWAEAAATAQCADWSRQWWQAEEAAAAALHRSASSLFGETPLLASLSAVTLAAAALHGTAARALSRAEAEDAALSRVAAGAAALACHQMGLAIAADAAEDHPLALKYRLFAGGRWLLGVMGDRCYLF